MNVYDFDNTLYDGESILQMFSMHLKRNPGIILYTPFILYGLYRYKHDKMTEEEMLARCSSLVKGLLRGAQDAESDAAAFWDKYEHRLFPYYKHQQRPDDLVISAGPENSLREICKRMGISRYIGTAVDEETKTIAYFCFGSNKVKAFRERYPDEEIDNFYTDSMSDKPLMDIARHVFLVKKGWLKQIK